MARSERDWRIDLIEAYPDLFHPLPTDPRVTEASPKCGSGWRELLERTCARIRAALQANGGTFKFTQIKEKYATARLDWDGALSVDANTRIEEIIDLAWARSACTCEICGAEGCLHRAGDWLMTRCAAHAQGHPVPEKTGWENVTISHVVARGTKTVIVKRRRYVRETDHFVEIDPLIIGDGGSSMAKFRCRTCGKEGTFVYDPERYTCPICDSIDVQFAIGIEELDDDYPLIEAMRRRAEDGEKNGD
jgi:hypothetical protein